MFVRKGAISVSGWTIRTRSFQTCSIYDRAKLDDLWGSWRLLAGAALWRWCCDFRIFSLTSALNFYKLPPGF
jgi:hypothetical protein